MSAWRLAVASLIASWTSLSWAEVPTPVLEGAMAVTGDCRTVENQPVQRPVSQKGRLEAVS